MVDRTKIALAAAGLTLLIVGGSLYAWSGSLDFSATFGGIAAAIAGVGGFFTKRAAYSSTEATLGVAGIIVEGLIAAALAPIAIVALALSALG